MRSTGSFSFRGFHENQISDPDLRIVGTRMSRLFCEIVCASSTQT